VCAPERHRRLLPFVVLAVGSWRRFLPARQHLLLGGVHTAAAKRASGPADKALKHSRPFGQVARVSSRQSTEARSGPFGLVLVPATITSLLFTSTYTAVSKEKYTATVDSRRSNIAM
jgi:hypothetical protein